MKHLVLLPLLFLAACNAAEEPKTAPSAQKTAAKGPPAGGPPPIPPYQMRAEAGASGGEALFSNKCGACHLAGGMGTNLLTKQMLAAKRPPQDGMLANRTDLAADYVKTVVRNGKMAMPRLTKVDVTDTQLDAIADYLGKGK